MHLSQIGRMDAFEARVFGGISREHARMSGLRVTFEASDQVRLQGVDRDLVKPLIKSAERRFEAVHLQTKVTAPEEEAHAQGRAITVGRFPWRASGRAHALGATADLPCQKPWPRLPMTWY